MLDKIRNMPEKTAFALGLILILFSPLLLILLSLLFPIGYWTKIIIEAIICFLSILFILNAADKRHSRISKNK